MQTAKSNIESQRLALIQQTFNAENQKVETAKAINWNTLTNEQTQENLQTLLQNNYNHTDWVIADYNDIQTSLAMAQNQYLSSLRINNIDTNKTEKTGIHNYGRLYSNNDMTLNSNSVLHNNKGALIYSNNNINFNINKILFNNENNIGQGIYAKNNINILGYNSTSSKNIYNRDGTLNTNWGKGTNHNIATGNNYSLETLFNYDGLIEAENDINILADDVVNYGSDSVDLSKIDNEIKAKYKYYRKRRREISKELYEYYISTITDPVQLAKLGLQKEFQYYYVEESPELLAAYYLQYKETAFRNAGLYETIVKGYDAAYLRVDSNSSTLKSNNGNINIRANNTTNYNSLIFAEKNITINSDNLLNTNLQFNVNSRQHYQYKGKDCNKWGFDCDEYYSNYTQPFVTQVTSTKPSQILSNGSLVIVANKIGNGTAKDYSNYTNGSSRLPYTSQTIPENAIDNILKSGTLNPLTLITLPQGNYGVFRKPADPNSMYLFETDPTLVDTTKFLGSVYFMNRLGLDPYTIDLKFLGDAYMEFELLKRSIEQTRLMQHTYNNTDEVAEQINKMREATTRELANKLGLEVGKELTQEQIDNLEEDIIWYVEQSIELPSGEIYTALVPQIYYCKATLQKMEQQRIANTTYTLIAGDSVYLQSKHSEQLATATINNSGTIRANDTLSIQNFDIINNITSSIRNEDIN